MRLAPIMYTTVLPHSYIILNMYEYLNNARVENAARLAIRQKFISCVVGLRLR